MFAEADTFLDSTTIGPLHLRDPGRAQVVEHAILFGAEVRNDLFAWCIMANHVHTVLTPHRELHKVMQGLEGFTSRQINRADNRIGRLFWQDESYDHWARDEDELLRIIHYVEDNPVKAGLCSGPETWPWSSARFRDGWTPGRPYVGQAFQPDMAPH